MSLRKLIRVETASGEVEWLHSSEHRQKVVLRSFKDEKPEEYRAASSELKKRLGRFREFSIGRIAALTEDVVDASADQIPITDVDTWRRIIVRLGELEPAALLRGEGPRKQPGADLARKMVIRRQRSPIPQTRLRRFYEMLREFNTSELQKGMVEYLTGGRSDKIQEFFRESVEHFDRYANVKEAFRRPTTRTWECTDERRFAHCLVARLTPSSAEAPWKTVDGRSGPDVQAVDYEISPFRTTNACFENTKRGTSGAGGLDLILADRDHRLILGEIKAPTDTNLFLAFIQALTYSVELTTAAQVKRLKLAYPTNFSKLNEAECTCDIWLIFKAGGKTPALLVQTRKLARQLMSSKTSEVAKRVRRVDFVEARLSNGDVQLSCSDSISSHADRQSFI